MEIKFKRKEANHTVNIAGKLINFKNGKAEVDEATAQSLQKMSDPDYTVVEEKVAVEKPKSKPKGRRKAKPKKEE